MVVTLQLLFGALILILMVVMGVFVVREYRRQKRTWNQGQCIDCRTGRWTYMSPDSQGGNAYKCGDCGKIIWLDWIHPRVAEPTGSPRSKHL